MRPGSTTSLWESRVQRLYNITDIINKELLVAGVHGAGGILALQLIQKNKQGIAVITVSIY